MVPVIMASGIRIFNKVLEFKNGLTGPPTKGNSLLYLDNITMDLNMVTANSFGPICPNMKVSFMRTE